MTNTQTPAGKPILPSITGYPMLDTLIRVLLTSAAASITTLVVKHLSDMGIHPDPDRVIEIGAVIFSVLVGGATVTWSLVQTRLNQFSVVQHVVNAVATGEISDAVKVAAIKSPLISDETIIKASQNSEAIKNDQ